VIEGQVTKLVPFGAFVRVAPGIEGLVHISELSHEHVDTPESVLSVGDTVTAKVIDVDVQRRRVSLSMRQVTDKPRQPEIQVEEAPAVAEAAPEMAPAGVAIPQEIVDAVAEAEAAAADAPPAPEPEAAARVEAPAAVEPVEDQVAASDEVPAGAAEEGPAEPPAEVPPAEEPPAADAEVSLEAILEDLKRREGRAE
jgi:small subunit ribosomal protein S1